MKSEDMKDEWEEADAKQQQQVLEKEHIDEDESYESQSFERSINRALFLEHPYCVNSKRKIEMVSRWFKF